MWLLKSLQRKLKNSTSDNSERLKIARDLHDSLAQEIAALGYVCDEAIALSSMGNTRQSLLSIRTRLSQLGTTLREEIALLRDGAQNFETFINQAVLQIQNNYSLKIDNQLPADLHVQESKRIDLYRAVREILLNIAHHSQAKSVALHSTIDEQTTTITIVDDGIIFSHEHSGEPHHFGLVGVRERLTLLGGNIEYSRLNEENICRVTVPR